jgi:hypothetical protein
VSIGTIRVPAAKSAAAAIPGVNTSAAEIANEPANFLGVCIPVRQPAPSMFSNPAN